MKEKIAKKIGFVLILLVVVAVIGSCAFTVITTKPASAEDIVLKRADTTSSWTSISLSVWRKDPILYEEIEKVIENWKELNPCLEILDIDVTRYEERINITHRQKAGCEE